MAQPQDTIDALGLTVTATFVPFSASRNAKEAHKSLNWSVTLQRNGCAILTTDYSAGIAHCPAYRNKRLVANRYARERAIALECATGCKAIISPFADCAPRAGCREPIMPDATDVIYSLISDASVLDSGTFEQWAAEYGYDTDSRSAEATYRACLEIALQLRGAIGDAGISALQTAFQDY